MAIPHCPVKTGRAGKGEAHALYIQGIGRYANRDDVALVEHGNMPAFAATDPQQFWRAADAHERANGRAYREVQFAIPREIDGKAEQIQFARFFASQIVGERHAYTLALHDTEAADGGRNLHAHLMFTERARDGIERGAEHFFKRGNSKKPERGGCAKDRAMNSRAFVWKTRALYESVVNRELAARGYAPISMARNRLQEPEPKLGPCHARADKDERREERLRAVLALRAERAEARAIEQELERLHSDILDLSNDISAALAERDRRKAASERQASNKLANETRLSPSLVPRPSGAMGVVATDKDAPAAKTWYGWITAEEGERGLLTGLGVELGEYIHLGEGQFPARVDANVLQDLQAYSESFTLQFTPFDDGLVAPKNHRLRVPLAQASPEVLDGYLAYLRFSVASGMGDRSAAKAALDEARREQHLRTLEPSRQQSRADPDDPTPKP